MVLLEGQNRFARKISSYFRLHTRCLLRKLLDMAKSTSNSKKVTTSARVKNLRLLLGITQRELAKMLGVSAGAVAHWEADERQISGPVLKLLEIYERDARCPEQKRKKWLKQNQK